MKIVNVVLASFFCVSSLAAAPAPARARTVADVPDLSLAVLQRTLSPTIYKHILVSPIEALVTVRGQLNGTQLYGARVIHSEANGVYDNYALKVARDWRIAGHFGLGN